MSEERKGNRTPKSNGLSARWRLVELAWERLTRSRYPWVLLLLVAGSWALAPEGLFRQELPVAGTIAARDYLADRDALVLDEETTESKRQRARDAVLPIYDFDEAKPLAADDLMARFFASGRELIESAGDSPQEPSLAEQLETLSSVRFTAEQVALLRARSFAPELEDRIRTLLVAALNAGVVANKELLLENRLRGVTVRSLLTGEEREQLDLYAYRDYPDEVREFFRVEVGAWSGWSRTQRNLLVDFLVDNVQPDIALNLSETQLRREAAARAVEPVYSQVQRGQVVARKGDTLGAAQVRVLEALRGPERNWRMWWSLLGNAGLLLLVASAVGFGMGRSRLAGVPQDQRAFGGVLLLLSGALLAVRFGLLLGEAVQQSMSNGTLFAEQSYAYAIPYAAVALTASLLYGRSVALLLAVVFSILVGRLMGDASLGPVLYVLAGSLAAIFSLDRLKQRVALTRSGLVVGAVSVLCVAMLSTFPDATNRGSLGLSALGFEVVCALFGGILVGAVSSFLVPILESVLHVTTDIKLLELSDTNLPLLRRLAFEAPGTFQHSLMVANLAKAGCEAIGANAVLAYTAGLYHDVGKILRPRYFVENQREGDNPHDKLAPSISSMIVIAHVKDGLELAREYQLPRPMLDAIAQHHGSRRLTFFYNRAVEQQDREGAVDEHRYRYPGPKPQNKVMGVLMLADAVEAASRTLQAPTSEQLQGLTKRLLDDCVKEGQLDECDLTLADLRQVSEAIVRVLETIHHRRIDYPGYEFQDRRRALRMVGRAG